MASPPAVHQRTNSQLKVSIHHRLYTLNVQYYFTYRWRTEGDGLRAPPLSNIKSFDYFYVLHFLIDWIVDMFIVQNIVNISLIIDL